MNFLSLPLSWRIIFICLGGVVGIQMMYDSVGLENESSVSSMSVNPWAALCIYVKKKRKKKSK